MSASAILIPMAISLIAAAVTPGKAKKQLAEAQQEHKSVCFETNFTDADLLLQTLQEHGLHVMVEGDCFVTQFDDARIVYRRQSEDGPFVMDIGEVGDVQCLINELDTIEKEYNGNVQTYTYQRLMKNLPDGMVVENEQMMDDNSILLTLTVG
ncbi:MAG: hypothetical protein IKH88_06785 [Prevotella sp.]|nr:hypothetical protein [Prevotella sp.]